MIDIDQGIQVSTFEEHFLKLDAKSLAGIGGAAGIVLGGAFAALNYDFSKTDQMQQAVGSVLMAFILGAVCGWFIGKSNQS